MVNHEVQPVVVLPKEVGDAQVDLPQVQVLVDQERVGPLWLGFLLLPGQDVDDPGKVEVVVGASVVVVGVADGHGGEGQGGGLGAAPQRGAGGLAGEGLHMISHVYFIDENRLCSKTCGIDKILR